MHGIDAGMAGDGRQDRREQDQGRDAFQHHADHSRNTLITMSIRAGRGD